MVKSFVLNSINELNSNLKASNGILRTNGKIVVLSCKKAKDDKNLYWELEKKLSRSPQSKSPAVELGTSPFGPLHEKGSRKIFINLISAMNHSFRDYDFRRVKVDDFRKEDFQMATNHINTMLSSVIENYNITLRLKLWQALDEEVGLSECAVYTYTPDPDSDPFSEGSVWSFLYFFYNCKQKKIALFFCNAGHAQASLSDDEEDMDEYPEGFEMEC